MTTTDCKHEWTIGILEARMESTGQTVPMLRDGLSVYCRREGCYEWMNIEDAEAMLNEHASLKTKLWMCETALRVAHLPLPPYDTLLTQQEQDDVA